MNNRTILLWVLIFVMVAVCLIQLAAWLSMNGA